MRQLRFNGITKNTDRSATLIGLFWLLVFPFWQKNGYSSLTRDKWEGMLILSAVTVIVFCTGFLCTRYSRRQKGIALERPRISPAVFLALAYFGWVSLSAVFGALHAQRNDAGQLAVLFGSKRYEGLITQLCYWLIFLSLALGCADRKIVTAGAAVGLLCYTGIVFLQYAGYDPLGLFPEGLSVRTNPAFQGPIGNVDLVTGYVVLLIGFLSCSFLLARKGGWLCFASAVAGIFLEVCFDVQSGKIALLSGAAILLFAMLRNESIRARGWHLLAGASAAVFLRLCIAFPWADGSSELSPAPFGKRHLLLLLAFLFFAFMAFCRKKHPGHAWSGRSVLAAAVILLVLVLIVLFAFPLAEDMDPEERNGLQELQLIVHGKGEDYFGSWRYGVWRMTLHLAGEHLLFGTGPDTFWYAFNPGWEEYEAQLLQQGVISSPLENFDSPHNELLAILSNNGLPALLLYLALLVWVLMHAFSCQTEQGKLRKAAASGVLLYLVHGLFSFSICLVAPMFWAMLGIASECCLEDDREESKQNKA